MKDITVDTSEPADEKEVLDLQNFTSLAFAHANRGVFEVAKLHVRQIWAIVNEHLAQDKRGVKSHQVRFHKARTHNNNVIVSQAGPEGRSQDLWAHKIVTQRYKLVSQKRLVSRKKSAADQKIIGYFDVVFTADGYAFFGTNKREGKVVRNKRPFIASHEIYSLRPDDLPLGELHRRIYRLTRKEPL
jgi:hypothetical protein